VAQEEIGPGDVEMVVVEKEERSPKCGIVL
jgi:hypothetical protein